MRDINEVEILDYFLLETEGWRSFGPTIFLTVGAGLTSSPDTCRNVANITAL